MEVIKKLTYFIVSNFGPLVGFYFINYIWGFRAAVIVSILLVLIEYIFLKFKHHKISSFFYFSSGIIVVFGIADLFIKEPFFFKFEATLTNLFFALFFALSLLKDKPIVQEFAEMQKKTSNEQTPDKLYFFQFFTIWWSVYFVIKAAFYLWLNFNTTLDDALIIRMLVGKVSLWLMMFISIGMPQYIWKVLEFLKMFPSQKIKGKSCYES